MKLLIDAMVEIFKLSSNRLIIYRILAWSWKNNTHTFHGRSMYYSNVFVLLMSELASEYDQSNTFSCY